MKPWKSSYDGVGVGRDFQLQWGHGDEAVEEASSACRSPSAISTLQWGHGDEAVEERQCSIRSKNHAALQWGHGDEAVEEDADAGQAVRQGSASMGPRR